MKHLSRLAVLLLCLISATSQAQRNCATDQVMQELFAKDPQAKVRFELQQADLSRKVAEFMSNPANAQLKTQAIINIPVAVHILTSNPNQVTDATVQNQLDTLNWYYGGAPAGDSLRVYTPFRTTYGRSSIRFCLARRTPGGQASTGIERLTTSQTFSTSSGHPSSVVAAWDTRNYLNIWVIQFSGSTLGYSYLPGSFAPGDQRAGFVVDYRAFGSTATANYLMSSYNGGKTAVHEIGHYFNLQHTWGNGGQNTNCSTDDGVGDTPKTFEAHYGCNASPYFDACSQSGSSNGAMVQNHMDYQDDRCMILFTQGQVTRMEAALNNAADRLTLLNSQGCAPLGNPGQGGDLQLLAINAPNNIICNGAVAPLVTVRNNGTTTITAFRIVYSIDGGPETSLVVNGITLAPGASNVYYLASVLAAPGSHTITIYTTDPQSSAGYGDSNTSNDSQTKAFAVVGATSAPLAESFETSTFPPANWGVINPDNSLTFIRNVNGKDNAGSAYVNTWNYALLGQSDFLASPTVSYSGVDSVTLSFDVAASPYRYQSGNSAMDTLEVLVTRDCGNSFTTVYKKWGADLRTVTPPVSTEFIPSNSNQWKRYSIDLTTGFLDASGINVMFRIANNKENNIFLDNINITTRTLPAILKQQGYLVVPTNFRSNFIVWHYLQPTDLKAVNVYNAVGQLVWSQQFSGNATSTITVDMNNKAVGMYFVRLMYTNDSKNVTEKVIKQ